MKNCINCGKLLDSGDWWVDDEFNPDEVRCTNCHESFWKSETNYQNGLIDIDRRESELAEAEY